MKHKHLFFAALTLVLTSASICSCGQQNSKENTTTVQAQGGKISVEEFSKKISAEPTIQLVDVRTPDEFNSGHLKAAVNIDWEGADFDTGINKLDKNKTVYIYCRSGRRSTAAYEHMLELGFKEIYNMDGGIIGWKEAGKPVE